MGSRPKSRSLKQIEAQLRAAEIAVSSDLDQRVMESLQKARES